MTNRGQVSGKQKSNKRTLHRRNINTDLQVVFAKFCAILDPILSCRNPNRIGNYSGEINHNHNHSAAPVHPTLQQLLAWFPTFLTATVASLFLSGIVSWIANSITTGITIKFTSDMLVKGQANLQTSFNFTMPRLLSLLAASILTGFLIVLGFIAFVIPGVILALMFSLVYPAIMLEDKGVLGSVSRSRVLVSNRWLKTFGLLLLLGIIVAIANGVFVLIAAPFGVISPLISGILTALITPILAIAITLYYYSMKARILPLPPPPPTQTF